MMMFILKSFRSSGFSETLNVKVASIVDPGLRLAPCLFHVKFSLLVASKGVHSEASMLRVAIELPVFFM
jgi:hypothetical protein